MRRCLAALACLACWLPAQSPATSAAAQKRVAYYAAYRAWREADPDLERDLAAAPADQMRARIAVARGKAAAYTLARMRYYQDLLAGLNDAVARLGNANDAPAMEDIVKAMKSQQDVVSDQLGRIAKEVDALAADKDKALQRQAADRQWAALLGVQNNLAQQLGQIEEGATAGVAAEGARRALFDRYQAVSGLLRREIAFTEQESGLWDAYYASLEKALEKRAVPAVPPAIAPPAEPAPVAPHPPEKKPPQAAERWTGKWVFDSAKAQSYFGNQPESVNLQIDVTNSVMRGSYEAHYKLPKGSHAQPQVTFDFAGPVAPGGRQRIAVNDHSGFKGTIELHYMPGDAVEVVWNRTAAGKDLPFGNEVLYRRQPVK